MSLGHMEELVARYPELSPCTDSIKECFAVLKHAFMAGNKLLLAGNGGSAADAEHIVGELMKGFSITRAISTQTKMDLPTFDPIRGKLLASKLQGALPAISLASQISLLSAIANDIDARLAFAQQVFGYGRAGDVLFAITTSGNSENIVFAAITARSMGLRVIALTGANGGNIQKYSDVHIAVPQEETHKAQEMMTPVYHCLCMMLEDSFFG